VQDVLFARGQMAVSLAFHIVFAATGIALPLLMVLAELRWLKTRDPEYLDLARRWSKGAAVLFAVGAVSGTVLSFELGLLFPTFMKHAGPLVSMPFSLEGFAFFTEAIFLGIYLYGWTRVPEKLHLAAGFAVAASGAASALFVTIANAWMNAPKGFRVLDGRFVDVDPLSAMTTPFALHELVHGTLAAYVATAIAVAAVHAVLLLRNPASTFHRKALTLALLMAAPSALLQPLTGHFAGTRVAAGQPAKLAAIEQLERTQAHAPLTVGPIVIPSALSILAQGKPSAVVTGLDAFAPRDRPPRAVKPLFQAMVLCGMLLAAHGAWAIWLRLRRRPFAGAFLIATAVAGPLGFAALEAGWGVTELGRQPWVIYGVLRTADAVTPMRGLVVPFTAFVLVYLFLSAAVILLLRDQFRETT
jgi:cytochrome bd ubiquinol oxidase subunit I